jgi:hypothetical protein
LRERQRGLAFSKKAGTVSQDSIKHRDKQKVKPLIFAIVFVIIVGIIIAVIVTNR